AGRSELTSLDLDDRAHAKLAELEEQMAANHFDEALSVLHAHRDLMDTAPLVARLHDQLIKQAAARLAASADGSPLKRFTSIAGLYATGGLLDEPHLADALRHGFADAHRAATTSGVAKKMTGRWRRALLDLVCHR